MLLSLENRRRISPGSLLPGYQLFSVLGNGWLRVFPDHRGPCSQSQVSKFRLVGSPPRSGRDDGFPCILLSTTSSEWSSPWEYGLRAIRAKFYRSRNGYPPPVSIQLGRLCKGQ